MTHASRPSADPVDQDPDEADADRPPSPYGFVTVGEPLAPHEHRSAVLGEVHARPFHPVDVPMRVLHFVFMTDGEQRDRDRAALSDLCRTLGGAPPAETSRHHRTRFGDVELRWEQHSEFTTYSWLVPPPRGDGDGAYEDPSRTIRQGLPQPGPHLVSLELLLVDEATAPSADDVFSQDSLCGMSVEDGRAAFYTDFKVGPDGCVRILAIDRGLPPIRAGALVQRLLELETYRAVALLGLPQAIRISPSVLRIEGELVRVTREMTETRTLEDDERLLDRLAALAAELEAGAAEVLFRFGASRAYNGLVQGRLAAMRAEAVPDRETVSAFLNRRMGPALQTCATLEERQANLSRKLARATQLLRASVEMGMERQNRQILSTMSERTRLQLKLQQTVEGLSIAAISYYVVGLVGHAAEVLPRVWPGVDPSLVTALSTPVVVAGVALLVGRRIWGHASRGGDPG